MRYCDQYYAVAVAVILFYDFFLTLADEVSHFVSVPFRSTYCPSRGRSNTSGKEGNHGVRQEDHLSHAR